MDFLLRQAPPLLWQARERLAHFLGADPGRLVVTKESEVPTLEAMPPVGDGAAVTTPVTPMVPLDRATCAVVPVPPIQP